MAPAMTQRFTDQLVHCECCPRRCGVNRLEGETGFCRIAGDALISYAGLHHGEEPPISGSRGSGTIFFAHCNLRCVFCQNYQISQCDRKVDTWLQTLKETWQTSCWGSRRRAHNINLVSPPMWPRRRPGHRRSEDKGLAIPIVYNSNGYDSLERCGSSRAHGYLPTGY